MLLRGEEDESSPAPTNNLSLVVVASSTASSTSMLKVSYTLLEATLVALESIVALLAPVREDKAVPPVREVPLVLAVNWECVLERSEMEAYR